jgi:hypothetical protein
MHPNILTVFRRSDPSKAFIAKKVREESEQVFRSLARNLEDLQVDHRHRHRLRDK